MWIVFIKYLGESILDLLSIDVMLVLELKMTRQQQVYLKNILT